MRAHGAVEVAKTVIEVADVAWMALEKTHHHQHHDHDHEHQEQNTATPDEELESLRSENRRLKNLLEQNLKLLQNLSQSPSLSHDCPPDVRLCSFQAWLISLVVCIFCVFLSFDVEFCGIPRVGFLGIGGIW